jgi:hypothetical protein
MQACIPRDVMAAFVVYHRQDLDRLRSILASTVRGGCVHSLPLPRRYGWSLEH